MYPMKRPLFAGACQSIPLKEGKMELFEVNRQTCNQDGICAAVCPVGIIAFAKGAVPTPVAGAEEICIHCGHCVAVCPTGSLSHRDMAVGDCQPVRPEFRLSTCLLYTSPS